MRKSSSVVISSLPWLTWLGAASLLPLAGCSGMIADRMLRATIDPNRASVLAAERKEVERRWEGHFREFAFNSFDGRTMRAVVLSPKAAEPTPAKPPAGDSAGNGVGTPVALADPRPRGLVVCLHGLTDRKEGMLPYAELFARHGYVAVCVDLRGHGQSGGRYTSFSELERWDMVSLLDALGREGYDVSRVGVLGHSLGASTALQWAGLDGRVKAVIAIAPFAELRTEANYLYSIQKPALGSTKIALVEAAIQKEGHFRIDRVSPLEAVRSARTPIYFIRGDQDDIVPPSETDRLFAACRGPSVIERVPNAGHHNVPIVLGGSFRRRATEWIDRFVGTEGTLDPLPMWMTGLYHRNLIEQAVDKDGDPTL